LALGAAAKSDYGIGFAKSHRSANLIASHPSHRNTTGNYQSTEACSSKETFIHKYIKEQQPLSQNFMKIFIKFSSGHRDDTQPEQVSESNMRLSPEKSGRGSSEGLREGSPPDGAISSSFNERSYIRA
jgi:hypothetical protein